VAALQVPVPAYSSVSLISSPVAALLPEDSWEPRHELHLCAGANRANCEFLTARCGSRTAPGGAVGRASKKKKKLATTVERARPPACGRICTRPSIRAAARSPSVSTTPASRHRLVAGTDGNGRDPNRLICSHSATARIEALSKPALDERRASLSTLDVLNSSSAACLAYGLRHLLSLVICRASSQPRRRQL